MCGIFGYYGHKFSMFNKFADLNARRGNNGFGGLSISDTSEIIFRYSVPHFPTFVVPDGQLILGHTLASTGIEKRVHPFETDRFVLAHNGILFDYQGHRDYSIGPTDSQYILGGIQYNVNLGVPVEKAISMTCSNLYGQMGCWLWDKFDKVLYLWRVMSPVYVTLSPLFSFSTCQHTKNSEMLEEGQVYKFIYKTLKFEEKIINFNYYTHV